MNTKEHWAAALFLVLLAAVVVLYWTGPLADFTGLRTSPAAESARDQEGEPPTLDAVRTWIAGVEPAVNGVLDRHHTFIQIYGAVQRLAGRQVMTDADPRYNVVKLSDGSLTFLAENRGDQEEQAALLVRLRDELAQRNTPLLYTQAPYKVAPDDTRLPIGVAEEGNRYADQLLGSLAEGGVDVLDLRYALKNSGRPWADYFYKTDHHWNALGGHTASGVLANYLRTQYALPLSPRWEGEDAFAVTTYDALFLGSQGKRVGSLYGGVDDFETWVPKAGTYLNYEVYYSGISRTGPLERSVLFPQRVARRDWYGGNPYTYYSGGDYPMGRITNYQNPDGPHIFLVRDSFGCAVTPFLALACGQLTTFDLRHFGELDHLMTYVDWLKPDAVVCLYTIGSPLLSEAALFVPDAEP